MLGSTPNTNIAKNVILFIGDGMSVNTVTAARILKGQNANKPGEETVLAFEKFSTTGMAKVSVFWFTVVFIYSLAFLSVSKEKQKQ